MLSTMRSKFMRLKIGRMPYLNSEIFYLHIDKTCFDLVRCTPKIMGEEIMAGNLSAGPLSLINTINKKDSLKFLPFVVSTSKKSNSVLLFSDLPGNKLNKKRISITNQTVTSVKLLEILLNQYWKIDQITFVPENSVSEAKLLIGDEALEKKNSFDPSNYIYDLGEIWHKMTGLNFIFAQWATLNTMEPDYQKILIENISRGIKQKQKSLETIIAKRNREYMTDSDIKQYISSFDYEYNPSHKNAINEFKNLLSINNLKILFPEIPSC